MEDDKRSSNILSFCIIISFGMIIALCFRANFDADRINKLQEQVKELKNGKEFMNESK